MLEQSIAVIDSAIAQSRAALAKDPASGFLATQLNQSLEKKVELLRTAALLPRVPEESAMYRPIALLLAAARARGARAGLGAARERAQDVERAA